MAIRIIVVEDEPLVRELYVRSLAAAGFDATGVVEASACRIALTEARADLVMLDLGLPGLDGMSFARELHQQRPDLGLLIVSRRASAEVRIEALELGCDDYLVKPVHLGELCARAHAVARRRAPRRRLRFGPVTLDIDARTVLVATEPVHLTRGEFTILALLAEADGRIVTRERLSEAVSRGDGESDLRSVDALVRRIRRKLEPFVDDVVATAPGLGYRMGLPITPA